MPGQKRERVFALDVPGIHDFAEREEKDVDGRVKPAMTDRNYCHHCDERCGDDTIGYARANMNTSFI